MSTIAWKTLRDWRMCLNNKLKQFAVNDKKNQWSSSKDWVWLLVELLYDTINQPFRTAAPRRHVKVAPFRGFSSQSTRGEGIIHGDCF